MTLSILFASPQDYNCHEVVLNLSLILFITLSENAKQLK